MQERIFSASLGVYETGPVSRSNKWLQLGKAAHAAINGLGKEFGLHGCLGGADGYLGDTAELEQLAPLSLPTPVAGAPCCTLV
jgi:hypothetical protein